jgi:hypothetical protein
MRKHIRLVIGGDGILVMLANLLSFENASKVI